jgi:hypothetical protein
MKTRDAVVAGIAILGVILLGQNVHAATIYTCPIDGETFTDLQTFIAHYQLKHPGERIPIAIKWQ